MEPQQVCRRCKKHFPRHMTAEEIEEYKRAPMSARAREMYQEEKEDAEMRKLLIENGGFFNS